MAFFVVGTYRGVWRHFSLIDGVVIGKGVVLGAVASQLIILYLYRFESYSRVVFAFYAVLLMLVVTASRASFRLIGEFTSRRREGGKRLVIYGAGDAGAVAVRELIGSWRFDYRMVGFVDDDPRKQRDKVQGYPVLGSYGRLQEMIRSGSVDCVVVSSRDIHPELVRELESLCRLHGVQLSRLLFELDEVVSGLGPRLASPADPSARRTRG